MKQHTAVIFGLFSLLLFSVVSSQTCSGSLSYSLRQSYTSNSQNFSIFDISLENTGSCDITSVNIFYGALVGYFEQSWNIIQDPGQPDFSLINFGTSIQSGQSFNGAGVIIAGNSILNDPQFAIHGLVCQTCNLENVNLDISVFSIQSSFSEPASATVLLTPVTPTWYKVIGGGLDSGTSSSYYLSQSYPVNSSAWFVEARPIVADVGPTSITAYVVALFDPFDSFDVQYYNSSFVGANQASGSATVLVPSDYILIGGGVQTDEFVSANYPSADNAWTASFTTAPLGQGTGAVSGLGVRAYAVGIKSSNVQAYTVQNHIFSRNIPQPSALGNDIEFTFSATPPYRTTNGGFQLVDYTSTGSSPLISPPNTWKVSVATSETTTSAQIVLYNVGAILTLVNNNQPPPQQCSSVNIQQTLTSSWDSGSQWQVTVANSGSETISSLSLSADESDISNIWSITNSGNGLYSLPSWITSIIPGAQFSFGYVSNTPSQVNFDLQSVAC